MVKHDLLTLGQGQPGELKDLASEPRRGRGRGQPVAWQPSKVSPSVGEKIAGNPWVLVQNLCWLIIIRYPIEI